jgi:mono/diheme cytochrome c family protein
LLENIMQRPSLGSCLLSLLLLAALAGCADERYPDWLWRLTHPAPADNATPPPGPDEDRSTLCTSVQSEQPIPARLAATSSRAGSGSKTVFVNDLFGLFKSSCGGCHVDASLGGFQVGPLDFADKVDKKVIDRILSTDPTKTMPPLEAGGKLAAQRSGADPILELAALVQKWLDAGRPRDVFTVSEDPGAGGVSPYLMTKHVAKTMTNIGNCVPAKKIVGIEHTKSDALDAFFAGLKAAPAGEGTPAERIGLPERLDQTDLVTLDTQELAHYGVIAYAPTYPLWSDDAGKLRYVRVPRGQSIRFNPATQSLEIPPNTRFYKTFLKKIIDTDGRPRFRKIETRLIVSRPDATLPDGTNQVAALYGTYAWSDDETHADLVTDPLRDSEPFRDRTITYITDEPVAKKITDKKPQNLTYALDSAHALRRYAIPGSERCEQCHMGSPSQSFILGFTPAQIKRRPAGQGGVIEPAGPDELTQLQRLMDYGVVTGVDSPDAILPLEGSQRDRKPRSDYELNAQGYMLGNCAHCHNPRGYPSVRNPVLRDLLNFLPSSTGGGIFQFPLDRMSPRITRGLGGSVRIPYITPSLVDYPSGSSTGFWTAKSQIDAFTYPDQVIYAPWRSLIYRNVDTPFTYSDDLALFPHMPMNTPGFDCRAARIMGDWMVSIPALRKSPNLSEYAVRDAQSGNFAWNLTVDQVDMSEQPYVEVKPGDPDWDQAMRETNQRLEYYHTGKSPFESTQAPSRYDFCPDTSDIVDPDVLRDPKRHPVPIDDPRGIYRGNPPLLVMPSDGVPDRAHWVVTDLTQVLGAWNPRRPDWETILVQQTFPTIDTSTTEGMQAAARQAAEKLVVAHLQDSKVNVGSEFRSFVTKEVPFGLWAQKPGCKFTSIPTAGSFGGEGSDWMREKPQPDPSSPVYMMAPGEAVFGMICINCHGPRADSQGRQADNLLIMSGGDTRVADLRDGLFGPTDAAGSNRQRVFGVAPSTGGLNVDDWGARYMAWMGLGGTQKVIPASILAIVSNTQVLGTQRKWLAPAQSANMLSTAQSLCGATLPITAGSVNFDPTIGSFEHAPPLIWTNGDAEMWKRLCAVNNPPPVRALYAKWPSPVFQIRGDIDLYAPDKYPANALVGNDHGEVETGIRATNLSPWCVRRPAEATQQALADAYVKANSLPYCPASLVPPLVPPADSTPPGDTHLTKAAQNDWATRGAINAGLAVFVYLDGLVRGTVPPKPSYDRCEQLP